MRDGDRLLERPADAVNHDVAQGAGRARSRAGWMNGGPRRADGQLPSGSKAGSGSSHAGADLESRRVHAPQPPGWPRPPPVPDWHRQCSETDKARRCLREERRDVLDLDATRPPAAPRPPSEVAVRVPVRSLQVDAAHPPHLRASCTPRCLSRRSLARQRLGRALEHRVTGMTISAAAGRAAALTACLRPWRPTGWRGTSRGSGPRSSAARRRSGSRSRKSAPDI